MFGAFSPAAWAGPNAVVTVRTEVGPQNLIRLEPRFPGLSGAGSLEFGYGPQEIVWHLTLTIDTDAPEIFELFEAELALQKALQGRTTLTDEIGRTWNNVELVTFRLVEKEEPGKAVLSGLLARRWRAAYQVNFRWMQPDGTL